MNVRHPALLTVFVLLAGCQGDDPQPADPAVEQQGGGPPGAAPPGGAAEKPEDAAGTKKIAGKPAPPPSQRNRTNPPPALSPEEAANTFYLVEERANFAVIPKEEVNPSPDDFYVFAPTEGQNSSHFNLFQLRPELQQEPDPNFQLPDGFMATESAGYSDAGLPLRIRCEQDGAEMALVPGGVYVQGIDGGPEDAGPAHPMQESDFYMDVTEVTLEQWKKFRNAMRENRGKPQPGAPTNASAPPDHPALGISWGDAVDYARWTKKSLPTEAEWEKAARGVQGFKYPWGDGRPLWVRPRTPGDITAVAAFPSDRSVYGIYDLAGNAREWVSDFYDNFAYAEAAQSGTALVDWKGPRRVAEPNLRVVRGNAPDWALWFRDKASIRGGIPDIGFRCVLRIEPADDSDANEDGNSSAEDRRRPRGRPSVSPNF